jgi:predicted dehydrogenase
VRSVTATAVTDGRPIIPDDVLPSPNGMGTIAGERITALLQFDHAVSGVLLQHRLPKVDGAAYGFELLGTEGRLFWKSDSAWLLPTPHLIPDGEHDRWERLEPIVPETWDPSKRASLDDYCFVDEYVKALDEGRDHECSGAEGRHVMEVMMAIFESAAYGRCVDLPQAQRDHPLLRWRSEHSLPAPTDAPRDYTEWIKLEDRRLNRAT